MKSKTFLITTFTTILLTILISCSKVNNKNMTVIKDCTGSYLRFNGKDYQICNIEIVEDFENGVEVEASFERIDDCENNWIVCYMLHENEGWINVTKIE